MRRFAPRFRRENTGSGVCVTVFRPDAQIPFRFLARFVIRHELILAACFAKRA